MVSLVTGQGRTEPDADVERLSIRRLGPADLPGCLTLAKQRRWLAEKSKWLLLLEVGVAFGIDALDGSLAGTVVVTPYQDNLAVIGMLLVSSRFSRRGLGRRLMRAALDYAGDATVFLYSTAEGRPLYEALGFREVDRVVKYAGHYQPQAPSRSVRIRPAAAADLGELARIDEVAFGARREQLLARLGEFAALRYVAAARDGLIGYGAAWRSVRGHVIGPLVAADDATAEALADALARRAGGLLSVDVPVHCAGLARWAASHGLRDVGEAPLMVLEGRQLPGDRALLFAPLMQALG